MMYDDIEIGKMGHLLVTVWRTRGWSRPVDRLFAFAQAKVTSVNRLDYGVVDWFQAYTLHDGAEYFVHTPTPDFVYTPTPDFDPIFPRDEIFMPGGCVRFSAFPAHRPARMSEISGIFVFDEDMTPDLKVRWPTLLDLLDR